MDDKAYRDLLKTVEYLSRRIRHLETSSRIVTAISDHTLLSNIGVNTHAVIDTKLVTNGDSHNHDGGDGGQIDHTKLSNIGTNTHAQIDSKLSSLLNPPRVGLKVTTDFTSTSSIANVSWETELFDTDTMFNVANDDRITFTTAGLYLISGFVVWSSGTAGSYRHAGIYLVNVGSIGSITVPASSGAVVPVTFQAVYKMSAADYVVMKVQSGENETVLEARFNAIKLVD